MLLKIEYIKSNIVFNNINKIMYIQKPFLKWVGGKTQIIEHIIEQIPKEINNYHEIFLGGGSVLFAVLSLQKQNIITIRGTIYAYDINERLINTYINIQKNKDELYKQITKYKNRYDKINGTIINRNPKNINEAKSSKESYYYWLRKRFNKMKKNTVKSSALFIFLNKICFRGMYREGPNGFNVPYGHYKKTPQIINKKELNNISKLIQNVKFICCDYSKSLKKINNINDYVYLDPPYAPENKLSFVNYNKNGFDINNHKKLFKLIKKLNKKNIKFTMSNAKVDIILKTFNKFNIIEIEAKRAINAKNPESKTIEVIINNFK